MSHSTELGYMNNTETFKTEKDEMRQNKKINNGRKIKFQLFYVQG